MQWREIAEYGTFQQLHQGAQVGLDPVHVFAVSNDSNHFARVGDLDEVRFGDILPGSGQTVSIREL